MDPKQNPLKTRCKDSFRIIKNPPLAQRRPPKLNQRQPPQRHQQEPSQSPLRGLASISTTLSSSSPSTPPPATENANISTENQAIEGRSGYHAGSLSPSSWIFPMENAETTSPPSIWPNFSSVAPTDQQDEQQIHQEQPPIPHGGPPERPRLDFDIFRQCLGYRKVRLVTKDSEHKDGDNILLCFVDFDNPTCAATALNALQGYQMDEEDPGSNILRLQFSRNPGPRPEEGGGR